MRDYVTYVTQSLLMLETLRSFDCISMLFLYFFVNHPLLGKRGELKIVPDHRESFISTACK